MTTAKFRETKVQIKALAAAENNLWQKTQGLQALGGEDIVKAIDAYFADAANAGKLFDAKQNLDFLNADTGSHLADAINAFKNAHPDEVGKLLAYANQYNEIFNKSENLSPEIVKATIAAVDKPYEDNKSAYADGLFNETAIIDKVSEAIKPTLEHKIKIDSANLVASSGAKHGIKLFQEKFGINANGIVGQQTKELLTLAIAAARLNKADSFAGININDGIDSNELKAMFSKADDFNALMKAAEVGKELRNHTIKLDKTVDQNEINALANATSAKQKSAPGQSI
jgi:hypothetical protein